MAALSGLALSLVPHTGMHIGYLAQKWTIPDRHALVIVRCNRHHLLGTLRCLQ